MDQQYFCSIVAPRMARCPSRLAGSRFHVTRTLLLGDLLLQLLFLLHFWIADQPKYDPKSERCSGKRRNDAWRGLIEIENDESANQGEQRDQDNGAHLDDGTAMMLDDQQGVFKFKRR